MTSTAFSRYAFRPLNTILYTGPEWPRPLAQPLDPLIWRARGARREAAAPAILARVRFAVHAKSEHQTMPSLQTSLDYLRATHVGARGSLTRYPRALASVLRARARHGIGPRFHSLFSLIDVPPERWSDYLIDERLRVILRRINPPAARELVNDKLAFYQHCTEHGLPTIPIRCLLGSRPPEGVLPVPQATDEVTFSSSLHSDDMRLFFKLVNGSLGRDAFSASRDGDVWAFEGLKGPKAELFTFALARLGQRRGWIVQPLVESTAEVRMVTSSALSTLRIISVMRAGIPELLFGNLRISVGDTPTDNFSHGASGNLVAPVDLNSGRLGVARGSRTQLWPEMCDIPCHPNTGHSIEGFRLPHWHAVIELCRDAHRSLPQLSILGWDVALTDKGPIIVEANATFDVSGIQVAHRRGIRLDLGTPAA